MIVISEFNQIGTNSFNTMHLVSNSLLCPWQWPLETLGLHGDKRREEIKERERNKEREREGKSKRERERERERKRGRQRGSEKCKRKGERKERREKVNQRRQGRVIKDITERFRRWEMSSQERI